MIKEIREELDQLGEESYKQFNQKLIPGTDHVIGVRMPALRKLAKGIAKTDSKQYLEEAQTEIDERSAHEEIMLYGLVLGYAKMSIEQRMQALDMFVPKIHNWAVCDSCCMGYKFMEKEQEVWFSYLRKYQNSSREFEVRFFIVSLLAHYINEAYIEQVLEILNHTSHEGYYVKMAVAWAISIYFIKFPEPVMPYLEHNHLDDWTYNKALQKITESFRVDQETKTIIRSMKRPLGPV